MDEMSDVDRFPELYKRPDPTPRMDPDGVMRADWWQWGLPRKPPPDWGTGKNNVNKACWEHAEMMKKNGWTIDPRRPGNPLSTFTKEWGEKAKVLYLHGYGENRATAAVQTAQLDHITNSAYTELHYLEGFHKIQKKEDTYPIYPADPEYAKMTLTGDLGNCYFWWPLDVPVCPNKGDTHGWRMYGSETKEIQLAAVRKLVAKIESLGGVDGIVGFSMGGELAYLLLHHIEELPEKHREKLKFVGTICAEHILSKIPLDKPTALPFDFHMWLSYGDQDPEGCIDVPKAARFFRDLGANVQLRKMPGDAHNMPRNKHLSYNMNGHFLSALGRPYGGPGSLMHEDWVVDDFPDVQ